MAFVPRPPRNLLWGYILTPNGMCTVTHKTHLRPRVPPSHTEGLQAKGEGRGSWSPGPRAFPDAGSQPGPEGGSNPSHPPNTPRGLSTGRKGTQEQCHSPPPAPPLLVPDHLLTPFAGLFGFCYFFGGSPTMDIKTASLTDAGKQRQGRGPPFPLSLPLKHRW